ncbi:MAG: relaxase domain-containing protein [Niastella sp.]|nr:relaxase domain-containing protein [Niastella sp.]
MIRMIQVQSAAHAEDYFNEALSQTGYYINEQECAGTFQGNVADRLGLTGPATKEVFHALCNNINPATGQSLTPRTAENRTVYYDINFHCPKSVSIAFSIHGDKNILAAFQDSVRETMQDIECDAQTRIRKNGQDDNRPTGELLYADFVHFTSRPVDDDSFPDPHLHCHCTTFNATWDDTEQQYKAGQFRDIKRDMPYYQERYYKRLADRLIALGYGIRRTATAFELDAIPQPVIDLFSKRTQEVKRIAKEKNITDAAQLDQLGAQTRSKKKKDLSMADLENDWRRQIAELNLNDTTSGNASSAQGALSITPEQCIDHALAQRFERASVAHDRRILATAYRHGLGCAGLSLDEITQAFRDDRRIIQIKDGQRLMCTTDEALAEEKRMVDLAKAGKGQCIPLYRTVPPLTVSGDQAEAVTHILTSSDRVSNVQGGAGTGKTTTLKELVAHIHAAGIKTTLVAPTANASRGVMREEGFAEADTVAKLLNDANMQAALQDGVLIVDEAGLLGIRDMTALLQLVTDKNARLILFGDTRQHSSVIRGDALRILNTVAGIKAAEINRIYRQRHECYRKAVEELAAGNVKAAFQQLESFNAIIETDPDTLNGLLVRDYMDAVSCGKTALVVSPTHRQGESVTADIRNALRATGAIGPEDRTVTRYINLNYTEADKADSRMYQPGLAVQFSQSLKGIPRGSIWQVTVASGDQVTIIGPDGNAASLPLDMAHRFTVYRKTTLPLATGDRVTVTRNAFDRKGKRLNNGQSLTVVSVRDDGNIVLVNPASRIEYILGREFGHINHGYATTSHASQGKTVDEVFIAQPASTFGASNIKQFYVSISRARDRVHIYTDDKAALLDHVSGMGDRQSALELVGSDHDSMFAAELHARLQQPSPWTALYQDLQPSAPLNPVGIHAPEPV